MKGGNCMDEMTLSIAIPTYNRSDFLDFFLEIHVPIARKYNVNFYISDNSSSDDTIEVIKKWKKIYDSIYYFSFDSTVSGDKNRDKVLSMSESKYTWLMGDTYEIPESSLVQVIDFLSNNKNYEFVVVNFCNNIKEINNCEYDDPNKVLKDLAWMISGICCNIFHKSVIGKGEYDYDGNEDFAHVGFVLNFLLKKKALLYWMQTVSVVSLKTPVRKEGWGKRFFLIMFENWPKFIYGLSEEFDSSSKDSALMTLPRKTRILSAKSMLSLRGQGNFDWNKYNEYKDRFWIAPRFFRYYSFVISIFPIFFCKGLIVVVEWVRRKRYQIKKKINPKVVI